MSCFFLYSGLIFQAKVLYYQEFYTKPPAKVPTHRHYHSVKNAVLNSVKVSDVKSVSKVA